MAYTPRTWNTGDLITAPELNELEQGVAAASTGSACALREFARVPTLRCDAATLTRWAAAVARVRAGTGDAKLLMVGDSTTIGIYGNGNATVPDYGSPAATLVAQLDQGYLPTVNGMGIPASSVTDTDQRWTPGTGWSKSGDLTVAGFGGLDCLYEAISPTGALTYADPRILADTFDVYYVGNAGSLGSITATATGGSGATVNTGGAAGPGIYKVTVSAASAAWTNSASITASGGAPVFIVAVEPRLVSSGGVIRVANAGASGSSTTTWTAFSSGNPANAYNGPVAIKAYAPDLTIINLQINDANNGGGLAVATHRSQLQTLVTAAQVSGDVILVSCNPSQADAVSSLERQYTADEKTTFTSCGYIDYLAACGSWTRFNGLGYVNDSLHQNAKGYEHRGRALADVVRRIA